MAAGTLADDLTTDHGAQMTGKWAWTIDTDTGRWTRPQQAIKSNRQRLAVKDRVTDNHGVLRTRLKVRGKGDCLVVRYESEEGKDFQLLGYAIPYSIETAD
jgi:hypothetical protein